ncbi:hypothetical protein ACFLR1_04965 [Bacteroidota bacterium]
MSVSYAQDSNLTETEFNKELVKESKLAARKEKQQEERNNTNYKPIIGLGAGILNYFGEVNNISRTTPLIGNFAFQASVIKNVSPSFGLQLDVTYGKLTSVERSITNNRNFSTELITFNVSGTYNFTGLLPVKRFLNPFISVGIGVVNFSPKGDNKSSDGQSYNYWSDGTIRALAETDPNANVKTPVLQRDYVFETDLRKANLDGLGKYKEYSFTLPFTFGIHFKLSPRSSMRLSSTFSYTFTDQIDNYSSKGVADRKGNPANDMFMYSSVSYHFDFFTRKDKSSAYDNVDFFDLEKDSDGDGVPDFEDHCPETPTYLANAVDSVGCPLDADADGVFDSLDKNANEGNNLVDSNSIVKARDTVATIRANMLMVYPDMKEMYHFSSPSAGSASDLEMEVLISVYDTDHDGEISLSELNTAIDKFFDEKIEVKPSSITALVDYFFDQ